MAKKGLRVHLVGRNWKRNRMVIEVNHNPMQKRGIKILLKVRFGFHINKFFILFLIPKNNPNTVLDKNEIFILYSSVLNGNPLFFFMIQLQQCLKKLILYGMN